jgi:hypothetical protein
MLQHPVPPALPQDALGLVVELLSCDLAAALHCQHQGIEVFWDLHALHNLERAGAHL